MKNSEAKEMLNKKVVLEFVEDSKYPTDLYYVYEVSPSGRFMKICHSPYAEGDKDFWVSSYEIEDFELMS